MTTILLGSLHPNMSSSPVSSTSSLCVPAVPNIWTIGGVDVGFEMTHLDTFFFFLCVGALKENQTKCYNLQAAHLIWTKV